MKDKITVSCIKSNLKQIRRFVIDVLKKQHLEEIEIHSMVLAVDEVCANLIIHSNQCDPDKNIEVGIDTSQEYKITFDIIDRGTGFDIRKYPEPDLDEIIRNKRKGGVGLMLVKKIMDEIDFISKGDHSIVRLIKYIQPKG